MSSKQGRSVAKIRNRPAVPLDRRLEKNLVAYAVATGAALLVSATPSDAEVIYTPSNTPVTIAHANQGPVYTTLDLNNDGVPDFTFTLSSTLHYSSYGYTSRARFILKVSPDQTGNEIVQGELPLNASAVPAGVAIGPQQKFGTGGYMVKRSATLHTAHTSGSWAPLEFAYVGLKFVINGQVHYGWARIKFPFPGQSQDPSIYGYAYESTANKAISAGQTSGTNQTSSSAKPAPASLGVLAAGVSVE